MSRLPRMVVWSLTEYGSRLALAEAIGWDVSLIKNYLGLKPMEELAGEPFFLITVADLRRKSHKKIVVMVKRAIVKALSDELGSMRAVARFLGKNDKYLGQLMDEARS